MSTFVIEYVYDASRTEDMDRIRPDHRAFLRGLAESGDVLLVGPSPLPDGSPRAFVFVEAQNAEAALAKVEADPFYANDLITERIVRNFTVVAGGFQQA